jgi:hypothetical protein
MIFGSLSEPDDVGINGERDEDVEGEQFFDMRSGTPTSMVHNT